jgi:hypothetical protein
MAGGIKLGSGTRALPWETVKYYPPLRRIDRRVVEEIVQKYLGPKKFNIRINQKGVFRTSLNSNPLLSYMVLEHAV